MRLPPDNRIPVVAALGTAQTIAWASTYYLPAVLATPMARDLAVSPVWVFAGFSLAMVVSAMIGPAAGRLIDTLGGRRILAATNVVFASGLLLLASCHDTTGLLAAWIVIGLGMGAGLYEAAFSTLAGVYGMAARSPITGITLIAGFASTVGWPLSALMEAQFGWRGACAGWALLHLALAMPLNLLLPAGSAAVAKPAGGHPTGSASQPPTRTLVLLAFVFAATWFSSTAMAAHLPRLLEAAGASTAMAITAGALIGPAQVAARIAEYGLLQRLHPLVSARLAAAAHPLGAGILVLFGGPAAAAFAILHGAGNGVLSIAKGTLPLALFGPLGYGHRLGLLNAPARVLQAFAPLLFGYALERFGVQSVWLTAGLSLLALAALLAIRPTPEQR